MEARFGVFGLGSGCHSDAPEFVDSSTRHSDAPKHPETPRNLSIIRTQERQDPAWESCLVKEKLLNTVLKREVLFNKHLIC